MEPKPFINPYVAGVMLGVVLFAAFAVTHSGLGASGAVSVAAHPQRSRQGDLRPRWMMA